VAEEDLEKLIATFSSNNGSVKKAVVDLIDRGIIIKHEY